MNETMLRTCAALGGILAGGVFVALLSVALPARPDEISAGGILLDRGSGVYPFTIQNVMWLLFFAGLGDVCAASRRCSPFWACWNNPPAASTCCKAWTRGA